MTIAVVRHSKLAPMSLRVPGHKHAAVCAFAAAIATGCRLRLDNVPDIEDVRVLNRIVKDLGGAIGNGDGVLVDTSNLSSFTVPPALSTRVHGTLYLLPALLARFGEVRFAGAGGCLLERSGEAFVRPDAHIFSVLESFGATFERKGGLIIGRARPLRSCDIDIMRYSESPTSFLGPLCTGATKTAILAALGARGGPTRIINPIRRPEISTLLEVIKALGVDVIEEPGLIEIKGGLWNPDARHRIMPDLSALMTYAACAAYHGVPLRVLDVAPESVKEWLASELTAMGHMGIRHEWSGSGLTVHAPEQVAPIELDILPEGLATDHQPFFALLALKANGRSSIRDMVWPDRFQYAAQLRKLGALIDDIPQGIVVYPGGTLRANLTVESGDLRAAAVLVIAAMGIRGSTRIAGVEHLERGYENLIGTFQEHGAQIELV